MRTNAGADFQAAQLSGTPGAAATFMALTANATAPAATDTTLTGEIVTASGGLIRKAATYARGAAGATTYTLTATFTANANDSLPVTIAKFGVFTAASGGTLVWETALSSTATLSAVGDSVTITETIQM